jgi:voltage-gated potassium channel
MAVLALVVLVVLVIEFTRPITDAQALLLTRIDLSILTIFAADYFYRLYRAEQKWIFIKSNLFDLVAIMPFDKAFRIARLARLVRLSRLSRASRLSRLARIIAVCQKFGTNLKGILKTNGLQYVLLFTFVLIITGALGIQALEPSIETFGDALWWSLVTVTTVGYGDISPDSGGGRIVAAVLMLVGIGMIGMVTGSVATYFVDKLSKGNEDESRYINDEHIGIIKNRLDNISSLTLEDIKEINAMIIFCWERSQLNKQRDGSLAS